MPYICWANCRPIESLIGEIVRSGYVTRRVAKDDARATTVHFTARGRKLLENALELV